MRARPKLPRRTREEEEKRNDFDGSIMIADVSCAASPIRSLSHFRVVVTGTTSSPNLNLS